ncbi:MAG: NFACT RNA binding domain-containing protein [Eubacteriales bacterium]
MTIDGLTLYACIKELGTKIIDAKIDKIHQPIRDEIVLHLRTKQENLKLLISLSAGDCRLGLTENLRPNPPSPPTFCMFLRKHILNARIATIEQVGLERIVHINLVGKDELGLAKNTTLIVELMGKYSNAILINPENKILESAKHVPFGMSSVRQVLPGLPYESPLSDKYNPMTLTSGTFLELAENIGEKPMEKFLVQRFQGVSSHTAQELCARYLSAPYATLSRGDKTRFTEDVLGFFKSVQTDDIQPTIQYNASGSPIFFSVFPYQTQSSEKTKSFTGVNAMLDTFYSAKSAAIEINRKKHQMTAIVKKAMTKWTKKLRIQTDALDGLKKAEKFMRYGDLIMANIYLLKRGMDKATVTDYETGETVDIPLDKKFTPAVNAQKYFKRYNKMKKSAELNAEYIITTQTEIDFLESVTASIETCETEEELAEVRYELIKAGYISEKPGTKREKPTQKASKPHAFVSSDGYEIFVGKNNRQNDMLTLKTAEADDLWLHTQKIPGSHVIVKTNGEELPDKTIEEAASLAAYFSKAKSSSKVPVDYTPRKYIKKPNGAKPGYVIYETYYTLLAEPDENLVKQLKKDV